jgi:mono/diheme cytochrome c family protein
MDSLLKVAAAVAFVSVTSIGPWAALVPSAYSQPVDAKVGPTAPKASVEAAGIRLRSVGFELPTEGRDLPTGPGADVTAANCVACHTPGMILNQPALTRLEWTGEVTKMVKVYKAPVDAADIPAIVTYLAGLKVAP